MYPKIQFWIHTCRQSPMKHACDVSKNLNNKSFILKTGKTETKFKNLRKLKHNTKINHYLFSKNQCKSILHQWGDFVPHRSSSRGGSTFPWVLLQGHSGHPLPLSPPPDARHGNTLVADSGRGCSGQFWHGLKEHSSYQTLHPGSEKKIYSINSGEQFLKENNNL